MDLPKTAATVISPACFLKPRISMQLANALLFRSKKAWPAIMTDTAAQMATATWKARTNGLEHASLVLSSTKNAVVRAPTIALLRHVVLVWVAT